MTSSTNLLREICN